MKYKKLKNSSYLENNTPYCNHYSGIYITFETLFQQINLVEGIII